MSNVQVKTLLLIGSFVFSATNLVAATSDSQNEMNKDEWLGKLRLVVPELMCTNFNKSEVIKKQLDSLHITHEKCVELIPASIDKCQKQYYSSIPAKITNSNADQWGKTLGECIGNDFAADNFNAAAPQPEKGATDSTAMSKDEWLHRLKEEVPSLICKGFLNDASLKEQLTKLNINFDKCVTLIPPSIDKCQAQYYTNMPANITDENVGAWGHTIGECIGKDFAIKYLLGSDANLSSPH